MAAVELLAGSHALDTAADQPWLRDPGAGWFVMRDVAVALEAFLVLDARLEEVGLLTQHDRPWLSSLDGSAPPPMSLEERRLVTSQCARVAARYATSDVADLAVPRPIGHQPALYGPVFLVADPTDLAPAQRRLARFLRPLTATDAFYSGEPEISAEAARHIVASQLFLCGCFADIADKSPGGRTVKPAFLTRVDLLKDIQPRLRYLVDVEAHASSKPRMWQQGELTSAMTRMHRDARDLTLTRPELHELANATHEVTQNLGRVLRRELLRDTSNLRIADPTQQIGNTRVHRGTGLEARLTDLINQPAPSSPISRYAKPGQRMALRTTLDHTATSTAVPSPFPAAPGLGASDSAPQRGGPDLPIER